MSKMTYLFPFIAGTCACLQGMINGQWQSRIGVHYTVVVNAAIVTLSAVLFFLAGNRMPFQEMAAEIRPWIMFNGLCGFMIIIIVALTFPKIGAASVVVLMISGQLVTGILLDHFGVFNIPRHPISLVRFLGIAFVFLGVFLTTKN